MNQQVHTEKHKAASARGAARTREMGLESSHDRLETEFARMCIGHRPPGVSRTRPFHHTDETDLAFAARFQGD